MVAKFIRIFEALISPTFIFQFKEKLQSGVQYEGGGR